MTSGTYLDKRDRPWDALWCLLFGCAWVGHTAYRLENDLGRTIHGELCPRCGRFKPREDGRERFERGDERTFSYPEPEAESDD